MTIRAVDGEVGADAGFERKIRFIRGNVTGQKIRRFRSVGEESVLVQSGELVAGEAIDAAGEVELSGVEGEGMACLWSVTNQAFAPAGDAPMLGDHGASIVDGQIEVFTFIVNE